MEGAGYQAVSKRIRRELSKWIARLQGIRAPILEGRPVEAIAARSGLSCYQPGDGLAEFGIIILRRDFLFRNCVQVRINHSNSDDRILVVGSVQLVAGSKWQLPIHLDLLTALRVLRFADIPTDITCARR